MCGWYSRAVYNQERFIIKSCSYSRAGYDSARTLFQFSRVLLLCWRVLLCPCPTFFRLRLWRRLLFLDWRLLEVVVDAVAVDVLYHFKVKIKDLVNSSHSHPKICNLINFNKTRKSWYFLSAARMLIQFLR